MTYETENLAWTQFPRKSQILPKCSVFPWHSTSDPVQNDIHTVGKPDRNLINNEGNRNYFTFSQNGNWKYLVKIWNFLHDVPVILFIFLKWNGAFVSGLLAMKLREFLSPVAKNLNSTKHFVNLHVHENATQDHWLWKALQIFWAI